MKKTIFALVAIVLMWAMPFQAQAQDEVEASVGADVVSSYVWRGQKFAGASVQPCVNVSYKGFYVEGWGSVAIDGNDYKEFDLTLGYNMGNLTLAVTDYWTDYGTGYFHYGTRNTDHVFNASVSYDFDVFSLTWDTNFTGADGVNNKGERAYSSYVEAVVPFNLGGLEWTAEVGATPWANDFYCANGFAVCDVSLGVSKEVKITDHYSLPIFAKATWNPRLEDAFFVFGISF